jgi:hypothetical protein
MVQPKLMLILSTWTTESQNGPASKLSAVEITVTSNTYSSPFSRIATMLERLRSKAVIKLWNWRGAVACK